MYEFSKSTGKIVTAFAAGGLLSFVAFSAQAETVGYWQFEEGAADTAATAAGSVLDSSGNAHHGTPNSGPIYRSSPILNSDLALEFDGSGDSVHIVDGPAFELTESLTIEACLNIRSFPATARDQEQIFFRGDSFGGADPYFLALLGPADSPRARFQIDPLGGAAQFAHLSVAGLAGEWIHLAGVFDWDGTSGTMTFYLNGALVTTTDTGSTRPGGALTPAFNPGLSIGNERNFNTQHFDGQIDAVRLSNSVVNPADFIGCEPVGEPGSILKTIVSGPDVDNDEVIDVVVEIRQIAPIEYDFEIEYTNPDGPDVLIVDTVPAEWQVVDVAGNAVTNGFGDGFDGNGGSGTVDVAAANNKPNNKSATHIDWIPDPALETSTINVWSETRGRPNKKHPKFAPTSCGPLYLNNGAKVFAVDGEGMPLRDPDTGEVLPPILESEPLLLAAVEDLNGGGLVGDGSGDEDGDGRTDLEEVRDEPLTDPCNWDTDRDGVSDGVDQCPITGRLWNQFQDPQNPGCWINS